MSEIPDLVRLRTLDPSALPQVADAVRQEIRRVVGIQGGHYAAPLGTVELAVALHYVFDSPYDRLIWDTGHQAYAHKILTGRLEAFRKLRDHGGAAGFPAISESEHDAFGTGHASTSIAAALGIAEATRASGTWSVAIIGDAALAGGPALEALNFINGSNLRIGIVCNDNGFSISPTVGALDGLRPSSYRSLAEAMGLPYHGPVDGHAVEALVDVLSQLKCQEIFFLHVLTAKGRGDPQATADPEKYHVISGCSHTAEASENSDPPRSRATLQSAFAEWVEAAAQEDPDLFVLTPGMSSGAGLGSFQRRFPDRYRDVGIGEATAVTLAAGLAAAGKMPVVHIYSTFVQRAVDQLIHDVGLQRLRVTFLVDRVGLCGADGPTHQGIFDLAIFASVPNLTLYSLSSERDLLEVLNTIAGHRPGPVAIRISKGRGIDWGDFGEGWRVGEDVGVVRREGADLTLAGHGRILATAWRASQRLAQEGIESRLVEFLRLRPIRDGEIESLLREDHPILILEEHIDTGSLGQKLASYWARRGGGSRMHTLHIEPQAIPHGSRAAQKQAVGIDVDSVVRLAKHLLSGKGGDVARRLAGHSLRP